MNWHDTNSDQAILHVNLSGIIGFPSIHGCNHPGHLEVVAMILVVLASYNVHTHFYSQASKHFAWVSRALLCATVPTCTSTRSRMAMLFICACIAQRSPCWPTSLAPKFGRKKCDSIAPTPFCLPCTVFGHRV